MRAANQHQLLYIRFEPLAEREWTMSEERIVELEMLAAEQERSIEELSSQIAEQWRQIDRLTRKLNLLTERFLEVEEQVRPPAPVTKPPHW